MKYGNFDDKRKEYVITTPETPYPWINYLGTDDFFSLMSNTGGGYSFYKDASLRRITRYRYNNVPLDMGGKYFYIKDGNTAWSPSWKPCKTPLDKYECRHGLGYTMITGEKNKLQAEVTAFVPLQFNGEVQRVKLINNDNAKKSFRLFSFVEFCLWNALDDMTNFQRNFSTSEVEIDRNTIYHKTEYRERRNHYAFYSVNRDISGFDTDRDTFIGMNNGFDEPEVVKKGAPENSVAHGWSPIASHCLDIELEKGEATELIFILGYAENDDNDKWEQEDIINKRKALQMTEQFNSPEDVNKALAELADYWNQLFSGFHVHTPDEKTNRMANIWNQYQCMVTFNMSRSASYFESGIGRGMGFRDSNQDMIGFVHQVPDKARQRIIDIAATQFEDGGAYHQYQPLTKKGNDAIGSNFNDDPLWLILSTSSYIKETGDMTILDEQVPFDNDPGNKASLFEHIKKSFYHVVNNLGPHHLPLIGRADWNDCLNLNCFSDNPDESFQTTENKEGGKAESVMIAGMFVLYGNEFVKICELMDKKNDAKEAEKHIRKMKDDILHHAWDGEWFIRAYDHFGNKIGSKENLEGRIFIEPQGFCVMAGIGKEDGKAQKTLEAVKQYLACKYGIVLLNPPFTKYYKNMGEISTYPQGYKENAGIFCHNNPWIMIAETMLGNGNQAFEYYKKICPAWNEEISELHKTEPFVYSQMIAGKDAHRPGEAKNSWLTGTAAWNYAAVTQYILGIQPDYHGIIIDPCIPAEWTAFEVKRMFRKKHLDIKVNNSDGVQKGVKRIIVNNKMVKGNFIPLEMLQDENEVLVEMGSQ